MTSVLATVSLSFSPLRSHDALCFFFSCSGFEKECYLRYHSFSLFLFDKAIMVFNSRNSIITFKANHKHQLEVIARPTYGPFFRLYRSLQPEVQNLPVCGNARSGKFSKKYCVLRSFLKNYCGCRSFLELPDLQKPVERFPPSGKFLFFYGRFCTSACNIENFYKIYKFCASVVFHGLFLVCK